MSTRLLLYKKELRQNMTLYLMPLVFLVVLFYLRLFPGSDGMAQNLLALFTFALPVTLAIAYGLQAFDVEEDAQTRDFLLVKPISIWRIVGEKYGIGLGILLFWTLLFVWGASPANLEWPSLFSVPSWMSTMLFFAVALAFGASFFTGLWIHGPKKLLVAAVISIMTLAWAFFTFSGFMTFLLHSYSPFLPSLVKTIFFHLTLLLIALMAAAFQLNISVWLLEQRPNLTEAKSFKIVVLLAILLFTTAMTLNFAIRPPIRSAYFTGLELFGVDQSFWVMDGAWNPTLNELAVAGTNNRIGLVKPGEKPYLIHQGNPGKGLFPSALSWSPNGINVAYAEDGLVYAMDVRYRRPLGVGKGESPCWSRDGVSLLYSRENVAPVRIRQGSYRYTLYTLDFYRADFLQKTLSPYRRIKSPSKYWYWDSDADEVYTLISPGQILTYSKDNIASVALPGFAAKRERVVWGKFYPLKENPAQCIITVFSIPASSVTNTRSYTIRFYRFNLKNHGLVLLNQVAAVNISAFIFNPNNGQCLWGRDGALVERTIPLKMEGR